MLPFKYASGREALITVVGNLPEVQPGEWLKLTGKWTDQSQHAWAAVPGRVLQAVLTRHY